MIIFYVLAALIILFLLTYLILLSVNPNRERPARIDGAT